MGGLRRLPRVIYLYRYRAFIFLIVICGFLVYGFKHTGVACNDREILSTIEQLCFEYSAGLLMGTICEQLCRPSETSSDMCSTSGNGKSLVFSATLDDHSVFIKSALPKSSDSSVQHTPKNEESFRNVVEELISKKLNFSSKSLKIEKVLNLAQKNKSKNMRQLEMQQILTLLQSQEYLLSVLFSDLEVFPHIVGTCGHLYAVEALSAPELDNYFFDGQRDWLERIKLAVLIMDFLEQLETDFPDPLRICDVKMAHFGLNAVGKVKFLDLDLVQSDNMVQRVAADGKYCTSHEQCDLFDCKASCNPLTSKCDLGVSNTNLQKILMPGLLMTEYTPPSLSALLRQCADTGRGPVPEDIRQRLYTTLTEMEQILTDKLSIR